MNNVMWDRVTVVGCGLIGASFALALRRAGACGRVAGWDTDPAALEEARRLGAIDEVDEAFAGGDGVSQSDLVYLAAPVGQIVELLRARSHHFKPRAVVTDAGSTKAEVCRAARSHGPREWHFVGGHPVAGSHMGGAAHARADLFEGAPYVLTPDVESDAGALAALEETLGLVGARVRLMTAAEHDRALAFVSHLPQLVSCALVSTAEASADAAALAGTGYRDMTRLAASPWNVWRDILATNPDNVAAALDSLISNLSAARDELREHSLRGGVELDAARALFRPARTN